MIGEHKTTWEWLDNGELATMVFKEESEVTQKAREAHYEGDWGAW